MSNVAVITFTEDAFSEMLKDVVAEGVKIALGQSLPKEAKPQMVNTANAKKLLIAKGHRVSSTPGFISFKKSYKLTVTQKGREDWFLLSEIEAIPSRI